MLEQVSSFSIAVIGPVVVLLTMGKVLYRTGHISDGFVSGGSSLVFNFALPALLFMSISQADFQTAADSRLIVLGLGVTSVFFALSLIAAKVLFAERLDRGVIVQGSFRANLGVIGLAYAAKSFGPEDFAQASVYMGALILLYNVLSVWVLNHYLPRKLGPWQTLTELTKNPIMLAIVAALAVSYWQLPMPNIAQVSLDYFAQLTLPLALLCTGASIRFGQMRGQTLALSFTVICKCLLYPLLSLILGITLNFTHTQLLTILFMSIAPTAAVSFIMVKKMGGNADLAANIVAITTVISVPFTIIGYAWISTL